MTGIDLFRFARGALAGHRLRSGLSLLGVTVGVTSVVILTSLGEGARTYVTGEFAALGSNLLIITPGRTETTGWMPPIGGAPHDLTLDDLEAVERVPGVRLVAPMVMGSVIARAGDLTREVIVVGTTAAWRDVRRISMHAGTFLPDGDDRDRPVCVIGRRAEMELFAGRPALGAMLRVGDERFRIVGVMGLRRTNLGMNLDDVVLVPIVRHMKMFNEASVARVLVEMRSPDDLSAGQAAVEALLTARHDYEKDVTVVTQESMLATFSRLLAGLTAALTGIAAVSLSVAGIGIMNVMLVSVSERTREIGLLKALGATPQHVLRIFLMEAALLSAAGGLAGVGVALATTALARRIYPDFPMHPPAWAIPAAVGVALLMGVLFGVLPARRAARLDPIRALTRR